MLERLAGCWSLLFHEAHAVLWISSLQTNHILQGDKQGPQDIHKRESNNMSMFINHWWDVLIFFLLKSTIKSKSSAIFYATATCYSFMHRQYVLFTVYHIYSHIYYVEFTIISSFTYERLRWKTFISWEKAARLPLNKSGAMAPSGSVNVNSVSKPLFFHIISFYNVFMVMKASGSSAN